MVLWSRTVVSFLVLMTPVETPLLLPPLASSGILLYSSEFWRGLLLRTTGQTQTRLWKLSKLTRCVGASTRLDGNWVPIRTTEKSLDDECLFVFMPIRIARFQLSVPSRSHPFLRERQSDSHQTHTHNGRSARRDSYRSEKYPNSFLFCVANQRQQGSLVLGIRGMRLHSFAPSVVLTVTHWSRCPAKGVSWRTDPCRGTLFGVLQRLARRE